MKSLGVNLGDKRLDARFAMLLSTLGDRPILSIPAACGGRAEMKAAYRFFDNQKVWFENVLEPHGSMIAPWAKEETAGVNLGDKRLDERIVILLSELGNWPALSIPAACGGRAEMKATYRFFDNDKVTFEKVIEPHVAHTKERMAAQKVVLLVQDTTEVDLTRPEQAVEGTGELDGARRGVLLHEMQAFVPDGTPLGTAWAEVLNRTEGVSHASAAEKSAPAETTAHRRKRELPLAHRHA